MEPPSPRATLPGLVSKPVKKRPGRRNAPKKTGPPPKTTITRAARQKQPVLNRALRDLRLIEMRGEGRTLAEMSRVDGRTQRTIEGILQAHRAYGIVGGDKLLKQDPVTIMREMLNRMETIYQAAFEAAMEAEGTSARLAGLKLMLDAQVRKMEMAQHLGLLPRQLGTFRHVIDLRQIGETMVEALLAVQRGEKTPEDAMEVFREIAGYGKPALPEGDVDGEAEEAAA